MLLATPAAAQRNTPAEPAAIHRDSAITIESEPGRVRVVAIAIPAELRTHGGSYRFTPKAPFVVLGRLERSLTPDDHTELVVFSVSVPNDAPAGIGHAGALHFTCTAVCASQDVAVQINVLPRRELRLHVATPPAAARAGSRARAELLVSNMGNIAESLGVHLDLPNNWRWRVVAPAHLAVAPSANTRIPLEISVPAGASSGDYGIVAHVSGSSRTTASTALTLRVVASSQTAGNQPELRTSLAFAHQPSGVSMAAFGGSLSGEFVPGIAANGRFNIIPTDGILQNASVQRAFGRYGFSASTGFLNLRARTWNAELGSIFHQSSGVVTSGIWGSGAAGHVSSANWRATVLAISPAAAAADDESHSAGRYLLATTSRRVGPVWAGAAYGDLRDAVHGGRTANTVAANLLLPWTDGSIRAEVGHRHTSNAGSDTRALAWVLSGEQRAETWGVSARAAHVPGGSTTFARADNELLIDGYVRTRTVSVSGGAWRNSDRSFGSHSNLRSDGVAISPQFAAGSLGSITLEARSSRYSGLSEQLTFTNSERDASVAWLMSIGALQTRVGFLMGSIERASELAGASGFSSRATRRSLFGSVGAYTSAGDWQLNLSESHTGAGVGMPSLYRDVALTGGGIPIVRGIAGRVEVLAYQSGASQSWRSSQSAGIGVELFGAYRLGVDVERNDLGMPHVGGATSPWTLLTRVEHSFGLPRVRRSARRGVVFGDSNGDGQFNTNEHGLPGVVVLVDEQSVRTDARGRFSMSAAATSAEVDPASLPTGWMIAPERRIGSESGTMLLRLVPTAAARIELRLTSTLGIDSANLRLNAAVIVLQDARGRRWTGTPDASGVLNFDALPPGDYTVGADLSRVGEVLNLPAQLPLLHVDGRGGAVGAVLLLSPRTVRRIPPSGKG